MDFTREPIIETVVTPKEGCKLVVRSSKGAGQEEHFVDAVEVVTFGSSVFYRSLERPKSFLVPAVDYEILEVREARMVLKNVGMDRSIKIGGGRETPAPKQKESAPKEPKEPREPRESREPKEEEEALAEEVQGQPEGKPEGGRKRDRRRQYRRRGRGEQSGSDEAQGEVVQKTESADVEQLEEAASSSDQLQQPAAPLSSILPPPPMLISETIKRYKDNALFKGAFYTKDEPTLEPIEEAAVGVDVSEVNAMAAEAIIPPIPQPEYGSFEASESEEEEIYRQRIRQAFLEEDDDLTPMSHSGEEKFPEADEAGADPSTNNP